MQKAAVYAHTEAEQARALAAAFQLAEKYEQAAEQYLKAAQLGSGDLADDYYSRGLCLALAQRYPEAEASLTQSLALEKDRPLTLLQRGRTYKMLKMPDLAAADFKRGLELRPWDERFLNSLYRLYLSWRDRQEAAELFAQRTGQFEADKALAYSADRWTETWQELDLLERRDQFLARVDQHHNHDAGFRARKRRYQAERLLEEASVGEAIALFRETNELDPAFAENYVLLGSSLLYQLPLENRNDLTEQEAIQAFRTAVTLDPASSPAHRLLSRALSTTAVPTLRDSEGSLLHAQQAIEIERSDGAQASKVISFLGELGIAQYRSGEFAKAIENLERFNAGGGAGLIPNCF